MDPPPETAGDDELVRREISAGGLAADEAGKDPCLFAGGDGHRHPVGGRVTGGADLGHHAARSPAGTGCVVSDGLNGWADVVDLPDERAVAVMGMAGHPTTCNARA